MKDGDRWKNRKEQKACNDSTGSTDYSEGLEGILSGVAGAQSSY